jgi:hypothetical protein
MKRHYTGNKDGAATGLRPGMRVFIREVIKLSNGALWNNGDFGVRNMRSKSSLSVHSTGRAAIFLIGIWATAKVVPTDAEKQ